MFGWGTSGNNHGAYCYQPWNISESWNDYYAYGNSSYNLYDQSGQADWGSNAISNGGTLPNLWRTLTTDEWKYLFNTRSTASGIRYAKAIVFNTNGVILLPDDWNSSYFSLNNTNNSSASFSSNTITTAEWSILEQHGAVFLCETGLRHSYTYSYYEMDGDDTYLVEQEVYGFDKPGKAYYWSSSQKSNSQARHLSFSESGVYPQNYSSRHNGMAVRLVCSTSQDSPTVTTANVTNITHCQATCGGTVTDDGGCEATVRGVCWSTTPNPTIADAHTIDGNGIGSFSSTLTGLMPSTTYYVRAYATNLFFTEYGSELSFTTFESPDFCTISVSATPIEGGIVNGGGTYAYGQNCSVHATANTGYTFTNWTENGEVVSTEAAYSFTVNASRTLVANFTYHAYVDLGLPSGLLWATCNVGAETPEDYGDYFAWGETQPKDTYSWSTYQHCNGSDSKLTKYCNNSSWGYNGFTDNLTTLLPEDDAATANWGSDWRMPTEEEWQELLDNTIVTWTQQNGVNGQLFTAANGNSLFLPAAGYRDNSSLDDAGSYGYYWSSSLYTGSPSYALEFSFGFYVYDVGLGFTRYVGPSVRPVRSASQN